MWELLYVLCLCVFLNMFGIFQHGHVAEQTIMMHIKNVRLFLLPKQTRDVAFIIHGGNQQRLDYFSNK